MEIEGERQQQTLQTLRLTVCDADMRQWMGNCATNDCSASADWVRSLYNASGMGQICIHSSSERSTICRSSSSTASAVSWYDEPTNSFALEITFASDASRRLLFTKSIHVRVTAPQVASLNNIDSLVPSSRTQNFGKEICFLPFPAFALLTI